MRFFGQILCFLIIATAMSCSKGETNNNATITINGRLGPIPSYAPYHYGTNIIVVNSYTSYLVESTSFNLASYGTDSVQVVLKDMGIKESPGPELYNVIQITPL